MSDSGNPQNEEMDVEAETKRFKLLLSSSPAVIYASKAFDNYAATYISENVSDLIGYQPTDFLRNPSFWVDHIHPQDKENVFNKLPLLFEKDFHLIEYRFQHKDGIYRWMRDEMKLIRDAEGSPLEIIGSWIDITSRKQAQLSLVESEERYRTFVHDFQGIAFRGTTNFVPVFFHGAVEGITGYSEKDFVSGSPSWDEVIFPEDLPKAFEDGKKMSTIPNFSYEREYRITKKDGQRNWISEIAHNVCDDSGNPAFVEGTIYDINNRKMAEIELAAQKERLAVTLRSIGDGVITTDVEGTTLFVNKMAENLTGWSQEEAAGHPLETIFNIINETTREPCTNPVAKVIDTNQGVGFANHEALLIARDGTERNIADSGEPIKDHDNNIIGFVLIFRDITDQLRMEQEILKVKKLESIGVLAGGIAHDFNNILAAILGNINLALFDADLKDGTRNLLANAEKASLRARDLTQQLLTFAKGGDPVKETSSLESVIKDSANFVLHGDKVSCQFDIPADLLLADIDKGQISQVIQNIIINASHAMPEGGTIKLTCENLLESLPYLQNGLFVKISIQDSGVGIPANMVEKIFDPYFSTKHEGSGLGLAISQSIIAKHNGHISVESSPGVGSTFNIYLPGSEKKNIQKQNSSREIKVSSHAKILIMDDDEMLRSVAKEMLVQLGHKVVLSADGNEAIKLYQESINTGAPFDLIIMDLTIPGGMGGEEAVQKILNIDPDAKVIVSSGYSNNPIMANFKNAGFCSAIVKPYQVQELSNIIDQLLD